MRSRLPAAAVLLAALPALATAAGTGFPPGTGVRGTVELRWSNTTGSPITAWDGAARLVFDPSAAARAATLAAVADPLLGEPSRALFAPQVQAARVEALRATRQEAVTCLDDGGTGYPAVYASSVTGVADGRVAWEITSPEVDLLTGRGTIWLHPSPAPDPGGWWVRDRFALPGRATVAGSWPCPGAGAPATRDPRILALNGAGAVPRAVSDRLNDTGTDWRLRRTAAGWRVLVADRRRATFSDSPFGAQDTQATDLEVTSDLYLAGGLRRVNARCRVPYARIERARSPAAALAIARRAGLTGARLAGTRYGPTAGRSVRFSIDGTGFGNGTAPCFRGTSRITRWAPAS